MVIKEYNLGLGAKKGSGQMAGQCVGLDVFQGILGRLNGKSDEVLKKEDDARGSLHRVAHIERRFGMISFVKGGLLVGDKIQALIDGEAQRVEAMKVASSTVEAQDDRPKDSTELKKLKRKMKGTDQLGSGDVPDSSVTSTKKGKKRRRTEEELSSPQSADDEAKASVRNPKSHDDRDKEKEARRQRKLERHARREAKRMRKEARQSSKPHVSSIETTTRNVTEEGISTKVERNIEIRKVPLFSARHAVRQRNIQHKRMAVMDSKSLNEIFMIKT